MLPMSFAWGVCKTPPPVPLPFQGRGNGFRLRVAPATRGRCHAVTEGAKIASTAQLEVFPRPVSGRFPLSYHSPRRLSMGTDALFCRKFPILSGAARKISPDAARSSEISTNRKKIKVAFSVKVCYTPCHTAHRAERGRLRKGTRTKTGKEGEIVWRMQAS